MPFIWTHAATRLPAQDLDRARRWYSEKLGFNPVEEREGGLRYVINGGEFCLFASAGKSDASFTQLALNVDDIEATVSELKRRGVAFEDYDTDAFKTEGSVAWVEGNYPSKGIGERAAWLKDSEGNMIGVSELVKA